MLGHNKRGFGQLIVVIGLVGILIASWLIYDVSKRITPGDCLDVSKYDHSGITHYCRAGSVERSAGTQYVSVTNCDFECSDYQDGVKVRVWRCALDAVNDFDAHKVSVRLCESVGK